MSYKVVLIIILGLLTLQSTYAQENFVSGEVTMSTGEVLKGSIDYRNWKSNPEKITFKEQESNEARSFDPSTINRFRVVDEVYVSAKVELEMSSLKASNLSDNSKKETETKTVFLQALIQGKKALYYLKDLSDKNHFYIKNKDSFDLLVYKKYKVRSGSVETINENKEYLGQLSFYLSSCSSIQSEMRKLRYSQKELTQLFLEYYSCTGDEIKFHKKNEPPVKEFGLLSGVSIASVSFSSSKDFNDELTDVSFPKSTDVAFGIFFDLVLPRNNGKWSINNELLYTSYSTKARYEEGNGAFRTIYNTELKYSYLKINNLLRYKLLNKNELILYANLGISNGFAIGETNYLHREFFDVSRFREGRALDSRKYEQGFVGGLGMKIKKFSLEFRYETSTGISKDSDLNSSVTRAYILLGYKF